MNNKDSALTIGKLAECAGVNIETVRYYQRLGLIEEPVKPAKGFRYYPLTTLERLQFIKRAQQLGFSLQEIAELLELGEGNCKDVRQRAEQKRDKIKKQIADLQSLQTTLDQLINTCLSGNSKSCPIVDSLSLN